LVQKKKIHDVKNQQDWRLDHIKFHKFGETISSSAAIKILGNSQQKSGRFYKQMLPKTPATGLLGHPWYERGDTTYEVCYLC